MKDSPAILLQGSVERVTFHSEASGFCVLRIKVKNQRELVTVIGHAANISAGEFIECQGIWINDQKHGLQFKAHQLKALAPTTLEGIEKYLGSGMVKGIGPYFAKKLVKAFGEAVFDVIEKEPERLMTLEGIGAKRKAQVTAAWAEQKAIREIMVFLQSHGVGTARSVRIYKAYGDAAISIVRENPYRLALDIWGIGFKTADQLAMALGIAPDSMIRAQAGSRHVLQELCDSGHCAVPKNQLIQASHKLLGIPVAIIEAALIDEIAAKHIVEDEINHEACLYPVALYTAETRAAGHLQRLQRGPLPWGAMDAEKAIDWVESKTGFRFAASQRLALTTILQTKLSVLTGGPGVGKTTIIRGLIKILQAKKCLLGLCAPTGRAAKRLSEITGVAAKTIHRLLDFDPIHHGFKHDHERPLDLDVLIIDEASMLDIVLLNHLLKALPDRTAVIFVGDIDQLPSVGSGAVLSDMMASNVICVVRLTEIFRQAKGSQIILNAHRINNGQLPLTSQTKDSDFFVCYAETPEEIQALLIELVTKRLPHHYQCDPIRDIQVLAPMNRGGLGSRSLNIALQERLNPAASQTITRFGTTFAAFDKVIQLTNNYEKDVFNGDIGLIQSIDTEMNTVNIRFDDQLKTYQAHELDEISLAYAISIHKSQGSEFPIVVVPLAMQHYMLLARNLLYTAITRGKQLVVLIGEKKAIGMAVRNNQEAGRLTKLARRLQAPIA